MSFKLLVLKFWNFWSGLFDQMPYGDPYIASMTLLLAVIFMCTYFFQEPAS